MTTEAGKGTMVGMGQAFAGRAPELFWAVLGSCVAVVLCDPKRRVGALSHVVLPSSAGRTGPPGKFADTAVSHMLQRLDEMGVPRGGLVAKLAGGASMFGRAMPMEVGENNVHAAVEALTAAGIRVVGKDVGGNKGRRVTLDFLSGRLLIESLGTPATTL